MVRPEFLRNGDKIGIVATGRKVSRKQIEPSIDIFTSWGLSVTHGNHLISDDHSYLSSTDSHRILELQQMIDDQDIKAIICARGGYGTTRILDRICFDSLKRYPKWLVGFSDVTALHLHLFKLGFESIHGTMPILFSDPLSGASVESLRKVLFGDNVVLFGKPDVRNRPGTTTGLAVGGNLSILADAIGTPSEPDLANCILILEEIDEHYYRIDRMLTHLRRSGKLKDLAGLVIGHFTDIKDTTPVFGESIEEIVLDKVADYGYPVGFHFPIGHENPNIAWIHGSRITLEITAAECKLSPAEGS